MLRDRNLIPLSHQHQHALALCVRIERAGPIPQGALVAWQSEIVQLYQAELRVHFGAEENVLFPAARRFQELNTLIDELLLEHFMLREGFAKAEAHAMSGNEVSALAANLSTHIRKEERQLFERMQELMSPEEMAALGKNLEESLKDAAQVCSVPSETTRLRPSK